MSRLRVFIVDDHGLFRSGVLGNRATNAKAKRVSLEEALKDPAARERLINANRCIYPWTEPRSA